MSPSPLLLLPDFTLILLGWLLLRTGAFEVGFWRGLERFVYFVLFPPLLFNAIAGTPAPLLQAGDALLAAGGAFLLAALLALAALPVFAGQRVLALSAAQTAFRFNSYLGLAVAATLHGTAGVALMGLILGVCVPAANVFAVLFLSRIAGGSPAGVARQLAGNPLIVATLAALAARAAGIELPAPVATVVARLGNASLALGLMCIGAGLRFGEGHFRRLPLAWFALVKLALMPLAAAVAARGLGLSPMEAQVALLFAALPTASSAYILAARMGGDAAGVAFAITAQTLLAMLSVPAWLAFGLPA